MVAKHGDNLALVIRVQCEHRAVKHRLLNLAKPLLNRLWDKVQHQLLWEVAKVAVTIKGFMVQLAGVWSWILFVIQIRERAFVQRGRARVLIRTFCRLDLTTVVHREFVHAARAGRPGIVLPQVWSCSDWQNFLRNTAWGSFICRFAELSGLKLELI